MIHYICLLVKRNLLVGGNYVVTMGVLRGRKTGIWPPTGNWDQEKKILENAKSAV